MIRLLFLALLLASVTGSQANFLMTPTVAGGPPPSYAGPGDVVSGASAWWGLRAYDAAVAAAGTQKAVTIRRASDGATQDVLVLSTGAIDTAAAATFCASTTCFVTTLYDQSGANSCSSAPCDLSQATAGNQPQLILSGCPGTSPCMLFVAASNTYLSRAGVEVAFPWTLTTVVDQTGTSSAGWFVGSGGNYGFYCAACASSSFGLRLYDESTPILAEYDTHLSALTSAIGVASSSAVIYLNGVSAVTGSLSGPWNGSPWTLGSDNAGDPLDGYMYENGLYSGAFTSGQATAICHNEYINLSTAVSC